MQELETRREVRVTPVGAATAVIELGGLRLLTDPAFDCPHDHRPRPGVILRKTRGPAIAADEVGDIDAVLLSHEQHHDNLDDAGRELLERMPLVLTTPDSAGRLGERARGLEPWAEVSLGGGPVVVTAVPARHGPEGCRDATGEVTGFLLCGDGLPRVYVSGDNASLDLVAEIAQRVGPVDVALIHAGAARPGLLDGALLTLSSAGAAEAARILGAGEVVPLHYEGWDFWTEGADSLRDAFAAAGLGDRLRLAEPGEPLALGGRRRGALASASDRRYGEAARNLTGAAADHSLEGARAALETFYHALNRRDLDVLGRVWGSDPLLQIANPVGGVIQGPDAIVSLYRRIFDGGLDLRIEFGEVVEYAGGDHVVFVGRETGSYREGSGERVPIRIRTTRYLRYDAAGGGWRLQHHHGSIDDAAALARYQAAVAG